LLLKQIYGLSDEGVCERWVYDPYFQYFTSEEFFQHEFPHERSDLSHWRKRLGDKLELLLAESLRVAHASGALRTGDLKRVTVDTTVQPKNITFPTDVKLCCTRRSGGSTASPTSTGCGCGNPKWIGKHAVERRRSAPKLSNTPPAQPDYSTDQLDPETSDFDKTYPTTLLPEPGNALLRSSPGKRL
jgi:hypothetical protein